MDNFWKGAFVPLRKHFMRAQYIRFEDMTAKDWKILDYPNLRPQAKRNIQKQINNCNLDGFFRVEVDQHIGKVHGGKSTYYYPSDSSGAGEEFNEEKLLDEFDNFDNYDEDVKPFQTFERNYNGLIGRTRPVIGRIVAGIILKQAMNQPTSPAAKTIRECEEALEEGDATQEEYEECIAEVEKDYYEYVVDRFSDWPDWALVLMAIRYEKCEIPDDILETT